MLNILKTLSGGGIFSFEPLNKPNSQSDSVSSKCRMTDKNICVKSERKSSAFTLAEVLITLVIIGVIAAITVPVMMDKVSNIQYKARLQKTYSTLSQAFRLTYGVDYNDFTDWNYAHSATFTQDVFNKISINFQIAKVCGTKKATAQKCWADKTYAKNGKDAHWFTDDGKWNGDNEGFGFILNDGTAIIMTVSHNTSIGYMGVTDNIILDDASLVFLVDVNGAKKPNILGKDIFTFVLTTRGIVPGGIDNKSANCDNRNTNKNWDCAMKVLNAAN